VNFTDFSKSFFTEKNYQGYNDFFAVDVMFQFTKKVTTYPPLGSKFTFRARPTYTARDCSQATNSREQSLCFRQRSSEQTNYRRQVKAYDRDYKIAKAKFDASLGKPPLIEEIRTGVGQISFIGRELDAEYTGTVVKPTFREFSKSKPTPAKTFPYPKEPTYKDCANLGGRDLTACNRKKELQKSRYARERVLVNRKNSDERSRFRNESLRYDRELAQYKKDKEKFNQPFNNLIKAPSDRDFALIRNTATTPNPIPEPPAVALFLLSVAGLTRYRFQK
jgi:hypothetical protein